MIKCPGDEVGEVSDVALGSIDLLIHVGSRVICFWTAGGRR